MRAARAQASLRTCPVSPEPTLLPDAKSSDMRGSRNFRQEGPGLSGKKALFLSSAYLRKSNGQFQRNLSFLKVPEGSNIFQGGGSNFFQGGVQL